MLALETETLLHHGSSPALSRHGEASEPTIALAREILGVVLRHRRALTDASRCEGRACAACLAPHLARVTASVQRGAPVVFVLPAFPGKSPNPAKVLGPRADMAERRSLTFLAALCEEIRGIYAPGARMVICSDGRVFSDVVGMRDADVTDYQGDIASMLEELGTTAVTTFNLDDVFAGASFDAMRARLLAEHAEPLDALRAAVREGGAALEMYRGITRFLLEDAARPDAAPSRTALQKDCRRRAYEVIQRSKAWGALLATCFPDAVRLSIHPQACGSEKIGLHLMLTADGWLTPWHGVAVEMGGRFALRKRHEAEAMGARLVMRDGRPSHYSLDRA